MITTFLKKNWGLLVALLLTVFAIQPLFVSGFFPIHDDEQVGRLYELDYAVKAGHIPPRLAQHLGFGYDYPLFNFYPSFIYYIGEIFHLLGFSYIVSIKLMIGLGFLLAATWMYLFTKKYFGEIGGVVASVSYTYAPYHSVDVYVRGALPEFWSFVFIPAIFWAFANVSEKKSPFYAIIAGVFCAFLVVTHNLVALMAAPFIGIFVLYLLIETKEKSLLFRHLFLSGLLAVCLPAYFWLPAILEKDYTMVGLLTTELANYAIHFVYIRQLWDSPWGYGGSIYGLYDGLSFQIGKMQIVGAFLAGVLGFFFVGKQKRVISIVFVFFALFVFAAFMTTFYSRPVWDKIQALSYIQFPWRYLLFTAFASSFLVGFLPVLSHKKNIQLCLAALVIVGIIFLNVSYFQPSKYLTTATDSDYINLQTLQWKTSKMAFEYVPAGIKTKKSDVGTTVVAISEEQVAKKPFAVISGKMNIAVLQNKPQEKLLQVAVVNPGVLQINTFSFPGWKVFINNQEVTYSDRNPYKLMRISLSKGDKTVLARFTDTPVRMIGNSISLLSCFLLIGYLIYKMYGYFIAKK